MSIKLGQFSLILGIAVISSLGCKKFLEAKPDKKLNTISSPQDLQSILDLYPEVNYSGAASLEASADNYYANYTYWGFLRNHEKNMYLWNADNVFPDFGFTGNEWSKCYDNIYRANTILENIGKIEKEHLNHPELENIKGQAFFLRGKCFLQASWVWSLAYDDNTASTDKGIPLRLNTDFNQPSERASVKQSYEQSLSDLKASIILLPVVPAHVMRASRPAAYALIARVYLSMRKYDKALIYADSCLQLNNTLMDYNSDINPLLLLPFQQFNKEVIYESAMYNLLLNPIIAVVDSTLYKSYDSNDIRKIAFFKNNGNGTYSFKGSYGGSNIFNGIATDEVYLIRAECFARTGNMDSALSDLNSMLSRRWKSGTFVNITANSAVEALEKILVERRKELIMRGIRFMDLKRLNIEGAGILLKRNVNNQLHELHPNDLRYALPIPEKVIELSGMQQNPR